MRVKPPSKRRLSESQYRRPATDDDCRLFRQSKNWFSGKLGSFFVTESALQKRIGAADGEFPIYTITRRTQDGPPLEIHVVDIDQECRSSLWCGLFILLLDVRNYTYARGLTISFATWSESRRTACVFLEQDIEPEAVCLRDTESPVSIVYSSVVNAPVSVKEIARSLLHHRLPYDQYLQTPEWYEKRLAVFAQWGHRCVICDSDHDLHVHHRTYARRGYEAPTDLVPLCAACHARHHETTARSPYWASNPAALETTVLNVLVSAADGDPSLRDHEES